MYKKPWGRKGGMITPRLIVPSLIRRTVSKLVWLVVQRLSNLKVTFLLDIGRTVYVQKSQGGFGFGKKFVINNVTKVSIILKKIFKSMYYM